jgi:ribosomal protein S18 acetylase RimI-like enzyme
LALVVRSAQHEHDDWIRELGIAAYAPLGDYEQALGAWLAQPGVQRLVAFTAGKPVGFLLLGFTSASDLPAGQLIADIVAIAVEPAARGTGVGRKLLACAVDVAMAAAEHAPVTGLRLTVAEDNAPARHLFSTTDFVVHDPDHGRYDQGQRALRLERRLAPSRS